jgi:hypothetical protein
MTRLYKRTFKPRLKISPLPTSPRERMPYTNDPPTAHERSESSPRMRASKIQGEPERTSIETNRSPRARLRLDSVARFAG